jgi:hypothetical protein
VRRVLTLGLDVSRAVHTDILHIPARVVVTAAAVSCRLSARARGGNSRTPASTRRAVTDDSHPTAAPSDTARPNFTHQPDRLRVDRRYWDRDPNFCTLQGDPGTYSQIWFDPSPAVVPDRRTSLIVDPPDGRIPFTPKARELAIRAADHCQSSTGRRATSRPRVTPR